jgi:hypothetical protein
VISLGERKKLLLALGSLVAAAGAVVFGLQSGDEGAVEPAYHGGVPAAGGASASASTGDDPWADDEGLAGDGDDSPVGEAAGPDDDPWGDDALASDDDPWGDDELAADDDGLPIASAKTRQPGGGLDGALDGLANVLVPGRDALEQAAASMDTPRPAPEPEARGEGDLDWAELFQQLLQKEQDRATAEAVEANPSTDDDEDDDSLDDLGNELLAVESAPPPDPTLVLSSMALRGVLAGPDGGMALLDGHMLRKGDIVPGTDFEIMRIRRDRIELMHPQLSAPVRMLLAPFTRAPVGTPAVSTPTTSDPTPEESLDEG